MKQFEFLLISWRRLGLSTSQGVGAGRGSVCEGPCLVLLCVRVVAVASPEIGSSAVLFGVWVVVALIIGSQSIGFRDTRVSVS